MADIKERVEHLLHASLRATGFNDVIGTSAGYFTPKSLPLDRINNVACFLALQVNSLCKIGFGADAIPFDYTIDEDHNPAFATRENAKDKDLKIPACILYGVEAWQNILIETEGDLTKLEHVITLFNQEFEPREIVSSDFIADIEKGRRSKNLILHDLMPPKSPAPKPKVAPVAQKTPTVTV